MPNTNNTESSGDQEIKDKTEELEKRIARGEKWMIGFTAVIAVSTIAYAVIAFFQWGVMSGQLKEIRSSSKQTDKIIEAANKQAGNTEKLAIAAINQVNELKASAKATQASASAAIRGAKVSEDTLHLTQGPDLEFFQIKCIPQSLTLKTEIKPVFRNAGRTRADEMQVVWHLGFHNVPARQLSEPPSIITLPAGGISEARGLVVGDVMSEKEFALVNAGKLKLSAWGRAEYKDIFGGNFKLDFDINYIPSSTCSFIVEKVTTIHEKTYQQNK